MADLRMYTFTITETVTYEIEALGDTEARAARAAGRMFSYDPQSYTVEVRDRDVYLEGCDDFTEDFEAGVEGVAGEKCDV